MASRNQDTLKPGLPADPTNAFQTVKECPLKCHLLGKSSQSPLKRHSHCTVSFPSVGFGKSCRMLLHFSVQLWVQRVKNINISI